MDDQSVNVGQSGGQMGKITQDIFNILSTEGQLPQDLRRVLNLDEEGYNVFMKGVFEDFNTHGPKIIFRRVYAQKN